MTKTAKKRTAARSAAPSSNRPKPSKAGQKGNRVATVQSGTKQSAAIEMLRSPVARPSLRSQSHRLAVAFGAWLSCQGRAQASQARFGIGLVEGSGSIGSRLSMVRRPRKRSRTAASPDRHAASQDRCGGSRDLLRRSRDRAPARSRHECCARDGGQASGRTRQLTSPGIFYLRCSPIVCRPRRWATSMPKPFAFSNKLTWRHPSRQPFP